MCDTVTDADTRGKAGTGSVLSLDAIGRQEIFLLGKDSLFMTESDEKRRHTNFSMYQTFTKVTNPGGVVNWPFGQTILVTLKPQQMGDLLKNMYLKCRMPRLQDVSQFDTSYCDQVGRAILQKAIFRVDGQEVETIYDDWNIIRDQLYLTSDQKISMQSLVNGGQAEGTLSSSSIKAGPIDLYIPLNFFFANNDATFFPMCAITQQKIIISLTFNTVSFFSDTRTPELYPGSEFQCSLAEFSIVCEQVVVSPEERLYLQSVDHTLLIETVKRQPVLNIQPSVPRIKNFLVPNIPVKSFHWFYRRVNFEDTATVTKNFFRQRYNFSYVASDNISVQSDYPILSDARFFMNGESQLGFLEDSVQNNPQTSYYYKYLQPTTAGYSTPERNVYTYTFSLEPLATPISGSMDFSKMVADKTFIDSSILASASSNSFNMHMFYIGLVTLEFSGGFLK